jgi:hypothetical protein
MTTYWVEPGPKLSAMFEKRVLLKRARATRQQALHSSSVPNHLHALDDTSTEHIALDSNRRQHDHPELGPMSNALNQPSAASDVIGHKPLRLLNTHAAVHLSATMPPTPTAAVLKARAQVSEVGAAVFDEAVRASSPTRQAALGHAYHALRPPLHVAAKPRTLFGNRNLAQQSVQSNVVQSSHGGPIYSSDGDSDAQIGQGALALQKLARGFQPRSVTEQQALDEDLSRVLDSSEVGLGAALL